MIFIYHPNYRPSIRPTPSHPIARFGPYDLQLFLLVAISSIRTNDSTRSSDPWNHCFIGPWTIVEASRQVDSVSVHATAQSFPCPESQAPHQEA
ncbi:hypothetical protein P170DRAFT_441759 [Aspergillus steynii IBT 23096]|uniref:Uncharacterized protein n=1 Tax=Aspergillus steynii IBT 23096 TaxID=1392250 RepID=A0A2I2FRT9_9EURO|nr:uncharacterized protein P170DRAFT_441759 [Aspergillus steynii IBT 23096]PLB43329.1 hypothetical protein P170DRAFT_441759 [Aspergillus steynii IBT 23096]